MSNFYCHSVTAAAVRKPVREGKRAKITFIRVVYRIAFLVVGNDKPRSATVVNKTRREFDL